MILNYMLTKEELFNFHKKHILNTMQYKNFINKMKMFYLLIGLLVWIGVEWSIKFEVFIGIIIIGIIIFIFKKRIYLYLFHNKLMILFSKYNIKYLFSPITLEINSEGIILNTSTNDELIKWKGIKDFNIVDDNVFIRTFTKDNIFIPSSAVKSEKDLNLLKELFMKYGKIKSKNTYPKDIQFIIQ